MSAGAGVSGLLLDGTPRQPHGASLLDSGARKLIFPHPAQNEMWWTGYAIFNPGDSAASLDLIACDNRGNVVLA